MSNISHSYMPIRQKIRWCIPILILLLGKEGCIAQDSLYTFAFHEIADMLDGRAQPSIRRAVFLAEWAYLDGNLDYEEDFCKPIEKGAEFMKKFISANNLELYKTSKQIALCDYFFKPWSGNNYTPFTYNHSGEFPEDDWRHQLVSLTLKTHKGKCHSLPLAFKLFAEAIDAEVYINKAPRHSYITYPDFDDLFPGDTVNVEVTAHQFVPSWGIKENMEICDSAVIVGTYMTPLTDNQTIACQLTDLAFGYYQKYRVYDQFVLECVSKSLEYYPMNPTGIIIKGCCLEYMLLRHLKFNGGYADNFTAYVSSLLKECQKDLDATHYTIVTEEMEKRLSTCPKDYKPIIVTK